MYFRIAAEQDCRAIYGLICEMENALLSYDRFSRIYRNQLDSSMYECLVCEAEGAVIAVLNLRMEDQLHHTTKIAEILEFAVHPDWRSNGIGRKLLAFACHHARQQGCTQIEVACNQLRHDTHRFYLREGMQNYHFRFSKNLLDNTPRENALGR